MIIWWWLIIKVIIDDYDDDYDHAYYEYNRIYFADDYKSCTPLS